MGLRGWFEKRGIHNLVELDWWQSTPLADKKEVFCLPTQHFSGRTATDTNTSLWCSWLLEMDGFRFYFGGDTGYGQVFRDIGELFAPIDLALERQGISEAAFRIMQHGEVWSLPDERRV